MVCVFFWVCSALFALSRWLLRSTARLDPGRRVVVVTGCDQGFGRMLTERLSELGCTVVATCLLPKSLEELKDRDRIIPVQMDVTNQQSITKASQQVRGLFPGGIHVLVNNAGIWQGSTTELTPMEVYRRSMEVNYFGMIQTSKAFLPLIKMKRNEHARIVNVCSIAGRFSSHTIGAYSASKFAAEAFTIALRQEMRDWGIKVVMIEPGIHATALLPAFTQSVRSCFQSSSPELQEEYGEEFVNAQVANFEFMKTISHGDPKHVVNAMIDSALLESPSTRYVIGFDAKYLLGPGTLLPDSIVDWIFETVLGRLVPKAIKKSIAS